MDTKGTAIVMGFPQSVSSIFIFAIFTVASLSCAHAASPCHSVDRGEQEFTSALPCGVEDLHGLEMQAAIAIPAYKQFVASEHFIEGHAALQFAWMGSTFRERFLRKIEPGQPGRLLHIYRLKTAASDAQVIEQMRTDVTTSLHDVWVLITRQSRGEAGPLSTEAQPNIFYIRDAVGIRWAVDVVWNGGGWEIGASAIDSLIRTRGSRVISP